ncbi:Ankyrin repeat and protein kinase domain-containing protein 1 [Channa argus]|uniref:Ankyrin repeat and protein kinase domain-containing protein 1 n=1 Tax=Channa argus TaxID=215402 RepID=A0A6G1PR15_CHAAH|nr:Ankyrin repeat and protein kinase domain-containing protein 1 [Channa argus]
MDCLDESPGQFRNFKKDDFEADWIKVAECRFGQVYQVKFKLWRERCALKSFDTTFCTNSFYRRIIEEASNIAAVRFKYITSVYGLCNEATGLVMEYMSNGSLNNLLATHTLMWPKKLQMIHEASMGMNFLHSMNPPLLHLNLKTSNILLDDHLHVKISDFGLIHWKEGMSKKLFMEHLTAKGNISYVPPETFTQCPDPPGITFDVYSFGIVIWEILSQQKPYADILMKTEALSEILKISGPTHCHTNGDEEQNTRNPWLVSPVQKIALLETPDLPSDDRRGRDVILSLLAKKDFGSFREFVKRAHVLIQFSGEKTLLHHTVASGDAKSVKHVLSLGAEVNYATARGYTPLIFAVLYRLHDIISLLLEHGAAANQGDEDQWTALHFAAQNGDDRAIRLLLDKGAVADAREKSSWMPLHLACQNGHETVVRLLLSRLSEEAVREREEAKGRTPLHLASAYGHLNIAKLLLTKGAGPNATDYSHNTPLHLSADEGHNRLVRHLLKSGANTDSADSRGYTSLHLAALKGHTGICRQLLSHGANPNSRTLQGWTPMHLAALRGHEATVVQLENEGGCVNAKGQNGWTPLHLACHQSEPEMVASLLAAQANPNVTEDSEGWTPLHVACTNVSFPCVLHLISHHADVNAVNLGKATPLHLAAQHSCVPIVKALLLNGADLTLLDSSGSTALNVAQRCEKWEVVQLLEKGWQQ